MNCGEVSDNDSTHSDTVRAVLHSAYCSTARTRWSVIRISLLCIHCTYFIEHTIWHFSVGLARVCRHIGTTEPAVLMARRDTKSRTIMSKHVVKAASRLAAAKM